MRTAVARAEVLTPRPKRGGLVLASVLLLCVLILSAQAPARGRRGSVLQTWILSGAGPILHATSVTSRTLSGAADSVQDLFSARRDAERLKRELARDERELFRLRAMVSDSARQRRLAAGADVLPRVIAAAPVLLLDARAGQQSALIGAGASDGVTVGSPIAVPEALLGRVVTVGRSVSRAQLLLDSSAAAGARIVRTGELGVVRGDGRGGLRLNNIPTTSRVRAGDLLESAGIDGIYPRGVPIGQVSKVSRGSSFFLEILVAPAVSFSQLTDVLVLAPSPAAVEVLGGPRSGGP